MKSKKATRKGSKRTSKKHTGKHKKKGTKKGTKKPETGPRFDHDKVWTKTSRGSFYCKSKNNKRSYMSSAQKENYYKHKKCVKYRNEGEQKVRSQPKAVGTMREVALGLYGKTKTPGGVRKSGIMVKRQKDGSKLFISKKRHMSAKKANGWVKAVKQARKQLGTKGFVPLKKSSKLYKKAKNIYDKK